MAGKQEIEAIYSSLDTIFRLSLGETGDYSGALYRGDSR
jgi:cyclopropane-fatty-acyl-phospholipid synthase